MLWLDIRVEQLLPSPAGVERASISDDALTDIYAYPAALQSPYVRANAIMSVNGAATVRGVSTGLGSSGDLRVYEEIRQLSDVVLVGAGTVRAEGYGGVRLPARLQAKRRGRGESGVPPIAVITGSADLDPGGPLFANAAAPTIVFTTAAAPTSQTGRLADAGADVVIVGDRHAEIPLILQALSVRGMNRILCEGGPKLFGQMFDADAVDEMCLSLSPRLVGGTSTLFVGLAAGAHSLRLDSLLSESGFLFLKYKRA
jgi:riboflavin biosynthesis pyrimidine reductase